MGVIRFKGIIFDLDGTLINTLADIALSMNRALEAHGFLPVPEAEYINIVGWGIRRLAYLALPEDQRNADPAGSKNSAALVAADAVKFYAERPVVYSKPYPGIPELLAELKQIKIKTAVLSNKPDPVAQLVVARLFPPNTFDVVQGEAAGLPRKPDPASTWDILMKLDITPRETLFAGDSEIDMETARAADCSPIGVSWGFRNRELLVEAGALRIVDSPDEILDLIGSKRY
ncbi:phosphoglycolate phosphatase [Spirochaetia bacterium]|nr:phosphoglycolate phosphatase [Spirochaetia bacterium]